MFFNKLNSAEAEGEPGKTPADGLITAFINTPAAVRSLNYQQG